MHDSNGNIVGRWHTFPRDGLVQEIDSATVLSHIPSPKRFPRYEDSQTILVSVDIKTRERKVRKPKLRRGWRWRMGTRLERQKGKAVVMQARRSKSGRRAQRRHGNNSKK